MLWDIIHGIEWIVYNLCEMRFFIPRMKMYVKNHVKYATSVVFSFIFATMNLFKANTFEHLGERWGC